MAERFHWSRSSGPYFFETGFGVADALGQVTDLADEDYSYDAAEEPGDASSIQPSIVTDRRALITTSQAYIETTPTSPKHVLRLEDMSAFTGDIFVNKGVKIGFDADGGQDTYFVYNDSLSRLELWVDGTLMQSWP